MTQQNGRLIKLIYVSTAISPLSLEDVKFILDGAQQKNAEADITGFLCYKGQQFFQYLEGPRDRVNQLFQSISHDARHYSVSLIQFAELDKRQFSDWSMNYFGENELSDELVEMLGTDIYQLSEKQANDIIDYINL